VASISGSPVRVALLGRALTAPLLGRAIAAPWALLWNDLVDGAPDAGVTHVARAALRAGRAVGARSTAGRRLDDDLRR
jgi:hypothetical protein